MLGIEAVAGYLPERRISNYDRKVEFQIDDNFIKNKLGIGYIAVKDNNQTSSDLCLKAYEKLLEKNDLNADEIDCCVVVTENPDYKLPSTAAVVQGKLGFPDNCGCFDIGLGCSGYTYGLSIIKSFMESNNLKKGLLFTSDPYTPIVNKNDKNTTLIFADGATASLISGDADWFPLDYSFGTRGSSYKELICEDDEIYMNGRSVFEFSAKIIPEHILDLLKKNNLEDKDIDKYILHQGSKFLIDTITRRIGVDSLKVPFDIYEYGNTISSSIPMILTKELENPENRRMLLSGFGVGLSWGSIIIERK